MLTFFISEDTEAVSEQFITLSMGFRLDDSVLLSRNRVQIRVPNTSLTFKSNLREVQTRERHEHVDTTNRCQCTASICYEKHLSKDPK